MSIQQDAAKVYNRISQGWCQHNCAHDKNGKTVATGSEQAVSWCLVGAMDKEFLGQDGYADLCDAICTKVGQGVVQWNDAPCRTQEHVLALLAQLQS